MHQYSQELVCQCRLLDCDRLHHLGAANAYYLQIVSPTKPKDGADVCVCTWGFVIMPYPSWKSLLTAIVSWLRVFFECKLLISHLQVLIRHVSSIYPLLIYYAVSDTSEKMILPPHFGPLLKKTLALSARASPRAGLSFRCCYLLFSHPTPVVDLMGLIQGTTKETTPWSTLIHPITAGLRRGVIKMPWELTSRLWRPMAWRAWKAARARNPFLDVTTT